MEGRDLRAEKHFTSPEKKLLAVTRSCACFHSVADQKIVYTDVIHFLCLSIIYYWMPFLISTTLKTELTTLIQLEIEENIFTGCRTMTPAVTQKGPTFQYGDLQKRRNITLLFAEE